MPSTPTHLYDCGVLLASLLELLKCQLVVLVEIHVAEDLVHTLLL